MQDFEEAVLYHEGIKRTQDSDNPAARPIIREAEDRLFAARFSLYELIQQLETALANCGQHIITKATNA